MHKDKLKLQKKGVLNSKLKKKNSNFNNYDMYFRLCDNRFISIKVQARLISIKHLYT